MGLIALDILHGSDGVQKAIEYLNVVLEWSERFRVPACATRKKWDEFIRNK